MFYIFAMSSGRRLHHRGHRVPQRIHGPFGRRKIKTPCDSYDSVVK